MHILPNSDHFSDFGEDISSSPPPTNLKKNDDFFLFEEPFDISSKKFVQLGSDYNSEEFIVDDQINQISKSFIFVGIEQGKLKVSPLKDATVKEVEQALNEDKLGRLEASEDGSVVVKFS